MSQGTKTVLHAGCADTPLPDFLAGMQETRLDAVDTFGPDIVATITALGDIGTFDVAYCSHCLEHVYPYQVIPALREFKRVLKDDGKLIIIVPDLEDIRLSDEVLYHCGEYPVTAMDMFFGTASEGNPWMGHHCGFTKTLLFDAFVDAGFDHVEVKRIPNCQLLGVASKVAFSQGQPA